MNGNKKHIKPLRILLSYSRFHFEPERALKDHEHSGSSAHILASGLHEILSEIGNVSYIDPSERETVRGKEFDLFVGQIAGFQDILATCQIKRSILFAVNMHPSERNRILRDFQQRLGSSGSLGPGDLVPEDIFKQAIQRADHILCVGNMAVYNSYIQNGVPRNKIKMLNYGVGPAAEVPVSSGKSSRFLYLASEIGLRKGFDIVVELVDHMLAGGKPFHLDIIGQPSSDYYQAKLDELVANNPTTVTFHGWVSAKGKRYKELVASNSFILGPALEEGQAGAVLDAMREGLIPILSINAGIDFSPLGFFEPTIGSFNNYDLIDRARSLSKLEVTKLSEKTLRYYREFHESFLPSFRQSIADCLEGHSYPLLSVTLPIFNKASTITELLGKFDKAAKTYGNIELHIIFDGCKDNTEAVARKFFVRNTTYKVTYETTPDIFEVKTNNIGLKKSQGAYCVILQDDNYINNPTIFLEAVGFLERAPQVAILGGLAGVNFYPRGTKGLQGTGQISMADNEVYWRQDAETDPSFQNKIFEVDACMRGPLFIRNSFLKEHGYLDEVYVPFYQDDMDLAFRARKYGYKVYAILLDVENRSQTVAAYNTERQKFWDDTMKKNTDIFYKRWTPTIEKDYLAVNRIQIPQSRAEIRSAIVSEKARQLRGLAGKIKRITNRG